MKNILCSIVILLNFQRYALAQISIPKSLEPVPTVNQMKWQEMEYYAFIHFSINTYTDMAWGYGNEDPKLFNPVQLDCRQWVRICKEAGMKGVIFTAKHQRGFCLWPSQFTDYSIKNIPWRNGKADIIREMADACKEYSLKFGVYLSPWDRNHPDYGKPEYITYFRNQLKELLTNYGDIFEIWFDGGNGRSGYYGGANETRKIDRTTYYDWPNTYKLVRELQPNIVIWNDGGDRADLRWVGTEAGFVGETNWSLLNAKGILSDDMLRNGLENGDAWVPGEVNTSIRPEWFYHKKEDQKVKTLPQLMDTYYNSVDRNGTLLLNFPIMPNGLINKLDEMAALDFAKERNLAFKNNVAINANAHASLVRANDSQFAAKNVIDSDSKTYWATNDNEKTGSIILEFTSPQTFNRVLIQEYISLGQRVKSFSIEAFVNNSWKEIDRQTTIGYKRILRFPTLTTSKFRLNILDSKSCPLISNIELFNAPIILYPPSIIRNQNGDIIISSADVEPVIYYTLDGNIPTFKSSKYSTPVSTGLGKLMVKAIALNPLNGKSSLVQSESFDISRKNWRIVHSTAGEAIKVLDGNERSSWHNNATKMPAEIEIDMGKTESLKGFKYLPDQNWWADSSIITHFEFYISNDQKNWKFMSSGEFSNIKNSPFWQTKTLILSKPDILSSLL
ncbi:MAG: alpha-L-fucosidase [Saprospiraceae bacterium]